MLFELTHKLPQTYWVAVSGGVDSMAALHWLNKPSNKNRLKGVIHINHGTGEAADKASTLVSNYAYDNELVYHQHNIGQLPPDGESKECWWRDKRYDYFKTHNEDIILAHNLNDCVEEYIMCVMVRGYSDTIPYRHANCIRPFRLWSKDSIYEYAKRNNISWVEDPSNKDTKFKRNLIRHELLPVALKLNPGLHKIVARLIKERDK